jgi:tripartite-type tricarboxylate transporter receptor subunit TctC
MNALKALSAALLSAAIIASSAQAQEDAKDYPSKPVHIVVGNAAGGGTDTIIRLIQPKLAERLGRPVVIENRPGGSNIIAVQAVAKAATDGYTLLAGTMGMLTINPAVFPNLPNDTLRDLVPISISSAYPNLLTENAAAPITTVADRVAYD